METKGIAGLAITLSSGATRLAWATASVLLYGCVAPLLVAPGDISDSADISNGGPSASVRGSTRGVIEVDTCYVDQPESTEELTIDPGPISIVAGCFYYGDLGPSMRRFAGVEIDAEVGHTYELRIAETNVLRGLDVIDLSDRRRLIARRPLLGSRDDATMSNGKAFVFVNATLGRMALGTVTCGLQTPTSATDVQNRNFGLRGFVVEPGRLTVRVTCAERSSSFGPLNSEVRSRYQTDIEFLAEGNRLYAIGLQSGASACIEVIDVTDVGERLVECRETRPVEGA